MNMRSVRLASLIAISGFLSAPFAARVAADEVDAAIVPGEILVGYAASPQLARSAYSAIAEVGQVAGYDARLNAARISLRRGVSVHDAIARLAGRPGVSYVEPNHLVQACATPNDPAYGNLQYGPQKIQANRSWDIWKPKSKVVVAIIDTGVEATHADLTPVMYRNASGAVVGWNTLNGSSAFGDDAGHGTHGAGVALAHINDAKGLAGSAGWNPTVAGSDGFLKIMPIKALNAAGTGTDASISSAIIWAADNGAKVINVSAASPTASATMSNAVQYAWGKGCVIVAAAGNEAGTAMMYPAAYPNVISVAATDTTDTLVSFSQWGSWIKCAAPGSNVYSTYLSGSYSGMSGTSAAAPHVAAEAAAILSQNPTLDNAAVSDLICGQVDPVLPYQGRSLAASTGRINVYRALLAAGDGTPSLTTVSFNPSSIPNQTSSTGTVQIGGPAPAGGLVVSLLSMNTAAATVPASVTIPEGETSITFTATGKLVDVNTAVTIKATAADKTVSGVLEVRGSVVNGLSFSPASVGSNGTFTGTVTLDAPARSGGAVVALSDDGVGTISTPASVTVPEGTKTVSFNGTAAVVARRTSVTVTATLNGTSVSATIMVSPVGLSAVSVNPTSILGGLTATGTVTLSAAAPSGGTVVALASSSSAVAKVPLSVTVSAGSTTATFQITTFAVSASKSVTISGTSGAVTKSATLTVTPMLKSVTASPTSVVGGGSTTGKVTLAAPAPAGGAVVSLSSSSASATVPASVTVPEGTTSVTFSVKSVPVAVNTAATITASYAGAKTTAKVTVKAPLAYKVTLLPTSVVGGTPSVATVTLTGIAPAGGTVVTLKSSNAAATVPASITVPAGVKTASFTVTTTQVASSVVATISAVTISTTKSAGLTINP